MINHSIVSNSNCYDILIATDATVPHKHFKG